MNNELSQPFDFSGAMNSPFIYDQNIDPSLIKNILFVHSSVSQLQQDSNSQTFTIVYNYNSSSDEAMELLKSKFSSTTLDRIGFAFHYTGSVSRFMNSEMLFYDSDLQQNSGVYSKNTQFIIDLLQHFHIPRIDFFACSTLLDNSWKQFYQILQTQTSVIVGASDNNTGNLMYGGDWTMESTQEDISQIYFASSIINFASLLDTYVDPLSNNKVTYSYAVPTSGNTGTAKLLSTIDTVPALYNILSTFIINNVTYTVTSIADYAFDSRFSLTEITIPYTITSINSFAFARCNQLKKAILPDNLEYLGVGAFIGDASLNSMIVPNKINAINGSAFNGCYSMTSITIGTGVKYINGSGLQFCLSLKTIVLPAGLLRIENNSFEGCTSMKTIVMPSTVNHLGPDVFIDISFTNIIMFVGDSYYKYIGTIPFPIIFGNSSAINSVFLNFSNNTNNVRTNTAVWIPVNFGSVTPSKTTVKTGGSFSVTFNTLMSETTYTISGVTSSDLAGALLTGVLSQGDTTKNFNVVSGGYKTIVITLENGASTSIFIDGGPVGIDFVFTDFLDLSFGLTTAGTLPQLSTSIPIGEFTIERDISLSTIKSAFYFQTNDPINYDASYTKYFVDISGWSRSTMDKDLNPMNYQVLTTNNGAFGTNTSDNLGKHFLRYIADQIFGTYLGVDLFNNEDVVYQDISMNAFNYVYTEVLNKLKRVDKTFGATSDLTDIFEDGNGWHMRDSEETYNICRNLLSQMTGSSVGKVRFEELEVKDGYTTEDGIYNVPFMEGDSIYYSVVVTPDPNQHLMTGLSTPISSKKYILKLNIV